MLTFSRLCGALGPASFTNTGAEYQSSLSSMWGSIGYLLSSLLQWYEAVNKHENVEISAWPKNVDPSYPGQLEPRDIPGEV